MVSYNIRITASAARELEAIPKRDRLRVIERIRTLGGAPRGPGCEKLSGDEKYRIRQGSCRILYKINDQGVTVCVVKIGDRKDVYR